ncbi:MAG: 50S ribosomal protein L6 [Patescibacteria group bacterium]
MSRVGKQPIEVPSGVTAVISDGHVSIKGPKGTLDATLHPVVRVAQTDSSLQVTVADPTDKDHRALWGLWQRLIANMVEGVSKGFEKKLELQGVGYRVATSDKGLVLNLGYSHPVEMPLPAGIEVLVEKNTIILKGIDKQLVGQTAARIRSLRKPEPYKGKGIRYAGEVVRMKAGKAGKAGAK